jgi:hypothetical protein
MTDLKHPFGVGVDGVDEGLDGRPIEDGAIR